MVDIANLQKVVSEVTEKAAGSKAGGGEGVKSDDIQRLQDAMKGGDGQQTGLQAGQTDQAAQNQPVAKAESSGPGNRILDSVQNMRSGYENAVNDLKDLVGKASAENFGPADAMKLQMKMQEVMLQQELMSKVVSKSTQNIDTLLKGQ